MNRGSPDGASSRKEALRRVRKDFSPKDGLRQIDPDVGDSGKKYRHFFPIAQYPIPTAKPVIGIGRIRRMYNSMKSPTSAIPEVCA